MSNKKERSNKKEISIKCFLGTTEKHGPFEKIGDQVLATKDHLETMAQEWQRKSSLRIDVVFN